MITYSNNIKLTDIARVLPYSRTETIVSNHKTIIYSKNILIIDNGAKSLKHN